jgi:hypothetical protein
MATDTMTTLSALFKTVYEPFFEKAFNDDAHGWKLATKSKRSFRGNAETIAVDMKRNRGVGWRTETQGLPTPQGPTPVQGTVALKRLYQVNEISHDTIALSKSNTGAFKQSMAYLMDSGISRMVKEGNRQFYGLGTGVLATVATGTGGTLAASNVTFTVDSTKNLTEGDYIQIWSSATATTALVSTEDCYIASILSETQILVNAGTDTTAITGGHVIRLFGDHTGSTDNVCTGLGHFADDGTDASVTFQGISRTTYSAWKGQRIDPGTSVTLTRDLLYRLNDAIVRKSGEQPDIVCWDLSMLREYLALIQTDIRYRPVTEVDAGYKASDGTKQAVMLSLGSKQVECLADPDVPYGTIFMFPRRLLLCMEAAPMQFADDTGAVLKQGTVYGASGTGDKFYFYARWKGNFATPKASAFGKLVDVAYTTES